MKTVNPFEGLGKTLYINLTKKEGFLPETKLAKKTHLKYKNRQTVYGKFNKEVWVSEITIGKDYKGKLKLPEGTEAVKIWNFEDGQQVIEYLHRAVTRQDTIEPRVFKNEFRDPANYKDYATLDDLIPGVWVKNYLKNLFRTAYLSAFITDVGLGILVFHDIITKGYFIGIEQNPSIVAAEVLLQVVAVAGLADIFYKILKET